MAKFGFDCYFKANEFEFCSFSYYTIEQFLRIFIRLVYSARATGCCNEAILFVLVYFTSIVGSISNRNKMQWNYSFGSGRAWVLLFAGNECGKSFERACYSRVIFEISPIRSSRRRILLEKFQTIVNDF